MVTRREFLFALKRRLEAEINGHPDLRYRLIGMKVKGGWLLPGRIRLTLSSFSPKPNLPPGFDEAWAQMLEEKVARASGRPIPPKKGPREEKPLVVHLEEAVGRAARKLSWEAHPIPVEVRQLGVTKVGRGGTFHEFELHPLFPEHPASETRRLRA
ncbi:MAG TPA: hypothetical protein VJI13_00675 [Candidatus Norongarragalinales archaeon]|nr:hypothetical protein [Candidatus Norongarragalinales archaeon]